MRLRKMNSFLLFFTGNKIAAITLAPFGIYFKEEWYMKNKEMVNHEKIHWKQQIEMLIILFYVWYLIEWFIKLFFHGREAYYHLSHEIEAYYNDQNPDYLKTRKCYSWIKYIFK